MHGRGACMAGMHGREACVVGEHAWQVGCMADGTCMACILNGSVRGRVSSSRKRFWTLPNLYSEVSALSDSQGYSSSEPV